MHRIFRRIPLYLLIAAVLAASLPLIFLITHAYAASSSASEGAGAVSTDWEKAAGLAAAGENSAAQAEKLAPPPPPKQDSCLHCHLSGEEKNIWTPLGRWVIFGGSGLIFAFGMYRTASVWLTRSPWKPLRVRAMQWLDERYQISEPMQKVLSKPVPRFALRWWYCLGGITAFLFAVQATTGIMLAFYYQPTPDAAYASIQYIEREVQFGAAIRSIHSWSANGMILMCTAHMLRVIVMGAYKPPRELNWISGVLLLVLTLVFGFTGYLLPWDQRAFWASTVGTEIAGAIPVVGNLALVFLRVGWDITAVTLSRFYALHVIVLPIMTLAFMLAHFIMIRRMGIAKPM